MNRKIIKQLKDLRSYKPDSEWKKTNRELLLSQIFASSSDDVQETKSNLFSFFFVKSMPQPMMATFLVFAILLGGGFLSLNVSQDAMPGDSLYIAKKLNEKAKLVITFDEKKKARLGLEFAEERMKEIQRILKIEGNGEREDQVNKLVDEVRKEIRIAKNRMSSDVAQQDGVAQQDSNKKDDTEESSDDMVFSAGLEKEEKGLQVSGIEGDDAEGVVEILAEETKTEINEIEVIEENDSASSSENVTVTDNDSASSSQISEDLGEEEILKTINELVVDLENAIDLIGEVKGVSEDASSSDEVIE